MKIHKISTDFDHEEVVFCEGTTSGLKSIIAIHNTVLGPSLGGVRMWPYRTQKEALDDVLRLSRAMTYKAAISGLKLGGGKGVIIGDPKKDKNARLLRAFGRFVNSLKGRYIAAKDVGTTTEDLVKVREKTHYVAGLDRSQGGSGDPSLMTAYGVLEGIRACVEKKLNRHTLKGLTVAIQGIGYVGYELARYLHKEGVQLIVTDIDQERGERAAKHFGAKVIPPDKILTAEADILAPCAMGEVISDKMIPSLKAKIIAGAANNQLVNEMKDGDLLMQRGILYAPDFVINAGGLINISAEFDKDGYNEKKARKKAKMIYQTLVNIFEKSKDKGISPPRVAYRIAEQRLLGVNS